jgi:toxin YoeB
VKLIFSDKAWEDYLHWHSTDPRIFQRLNEMIEACKRTPFGGLGKPEPLKGDLAGWWSRRLTEENRLVYRVSGKPPDQALELAQCRFHY